MTSKLPPMVKLIKHEKASEAFGMDLFYTEKDMTYETKYGDMDVVIYIPRGFLTDGASIPKSLQSFFPVWDTYYQAAVFHDYLCEYMTVYVKDTLTPIKLSREEVDLYFNEIMKKLNTNPVKRKLVFGAVKTYSHVKSIVYPSATQAKRDFENSIREEMDFIDLKAKKEKTA